MVGVKRGTTSHRRHKSLLELAKGYRNGRRTLVRRAKEATMQAGQFAYRDRRTKKRDLRGEWIIRINAAARLEGVTYSALIKGLKDKNIDIDRKILADLALNEPSAFNSIVKQAVAK